MGTNHTNHIPGHPTWHLPSPWDLIQAGPDVTSRAWVADTYGAEAVEAWEANGCPEWVAPAPPSADLGVIRRGWGRTRWEPRRH